jgi:hypothetical protein
LAERAKYRGSHGGAPETGFKQSIAAMAKWPVRFNKAVCGYSQSGVFDF